MPRARRAASEGGREGRRRSKGESQKRRLVAFCPEGRPRGREGEREGTIERARRLGHVSEDGMIRACRALLRAHEGGCDGGSSIRTFQWCDSVFAARWTDPTTAPTIARAVEPIGTSGVDTSPPRRPPRANQGLAGWLRIDQYIREGRVRFDRPLATGERVLCACLSLARAAIGCGMPR